MDMLMLKRSQSEEQFTRFASIAYRGIRRSLIQKYDGNDTTDLFRLIHDIISRIGETMEDKLFTENDRLINMIATLGLFPEVNARVISSILSKPLATILQRHIDGLRKLEIVSKKLHRRFVGRKRHDSPSSRILSKPARMSETYLTSVKEDLSQFTSSIEIEIVLMACIDKKYTNETYPVTMYRVKAFLKLEENVDFDNKLKLFITKVVQVTWSLTLHYQSHGSNISIPSLPSAHQNETERVVGDTTLKLPEKTKKIKGCKIEPWPLLGDWDEYMQRVFRRPMNYDIFVASSIKKRVGECRETPSDRSLDVASSILDSQPSYDSDEEWKRQMSPWQGHFKLDSYMNALYDRGVDYDIFLASSFKPQAVISKSKAAWETSYPGSPSVAPGEEIIRINTGGSEDKTLPISQRYNVYVRVIKSFKAHNKAQLNLKVGQILKQKSPVNSNGMAYGWTRSSRLSLKHKGFYPPDCVELSPDAKNTR